MPIFTSNLMPFTERLPNRKWNNDSFDSFADRIAQLKKRLINLLSWQAVEQPGNHTDVLAKLEPRLARNRAFYATNEVAEVFLSKESKQGGEESGRLVSLNYVTAGFLSFLWLRGPGWPPLEAIRWYGKGGCHTPYFKR
jgi:hypothetical protein